MTGTKWPHRNTLFVEDVEVRAVTSFPGAQYQLRLQSPKCAAHATPGSFVHLQCEESILMRRPLSIMRADANQGWIEVLFKIVGDGLNSLSHKKPGDRMSSIGPIGQGFSASPARSRPLLIGGRVGIPPMIFLAETLKNDSHDWRPHVIMGSEIPFPFDDAETSIARDWLPSEINRTMPLLENWGIPCYLASLSEFSGTYRGYVTDIASEYLKSLTKDELAATAVFTCGPTPMLKAVAELAEQFDLPCQVSLEEYMACGVGGCAGCTVLVQTRDGPAMKRVCVDGPVFQAADVFSGGESG